jgi:hypothetical protein
MTSANPPDSARTGPAPDGTPAERTPIDGQSLRFNEPSPVSDTLLSVPAPVTREDLQLDERLSATEQKLTELESRILSLERRPAATSDGSQRSYRFWLVFLAGLAAAWQIVEHFR